MNSRFARTTSPWKRTLIGASAVTLALLLTLPAGAQPRPGPPPGPPPAPHGPPPGHGGPPFGGRLFPPELVMRHQGAIQLTDKQRKAFVKEVQALQATVVKLQLDLHKNMEQLHKLLEAKKVDETKVTAQSKKVMAAEAKIKLRHLVTLVRIKNLLTAKQQAKLKSMLGRP